MRVYVLTESKQQFRDYCQVARVNPETVECVTDPRSLRGKMSREDKLIDLRLNVPAPSSSPTH